MRYTASQLKKAYTPFNVDAFIHFVMKDFDTLGFGERMKKITLGLETFLPTDFKQSQKILINALGAEIQVEELEGYEGFYVMPLAHYISLHGQEYFELSMQALYEMTKRFTAEFAIRSFLLQHERLTLQKFLEFAKDRNVHVRRLVSEGSRPRLPLAQRLHTFVKDPTPVFNVLKALKNEPTRLVQRSIANNLNDIAKDHPDAVVNFLEIWKKEKVKDIEWIIAHATRSLLKQGHLPTLKLLGFNPNITIHHAQLDILTPNIILGDTLIFDVSINFNNPNKEKVVIDYLLHFKKANGKNKPKVFKLSSKTIPAQTSLTLTKKHPIKLASTRNYYEGEQFIQLQVNGKVVTDKIAFNLHM